jgi:Bromodomain
MVGRGRPRGRGRPAKQRRDGRERPPSMPECFRMRCGEILDRIQKKDTYSIFLEPVDVSEAPEYDKIIKRPMDLSSIRKRLNADSYQSLSAFHDDLNLIWSNCLTYNGPEPSNIYSKKAIDLKKLTDRLIPSAKVGLDHDREVHDQWMERHRRKPHPSASPSSSALGLRFGADPAYPPPNGLGPAATAASLPVTAGVVGGAILPDQAGNLVNAGSVVGVDPPYSSAGVGTFGPTTPHSDSADPAAAAHLLILARREALREQYGTTGLYRPQSVTSSDDFVYLASDLPDFRPSSLRYNPHARIPDETRMHSGSAVVLKRRLDLPDVKYKILGTRRRLNPCRPIATVDSVRVKDYVQSLQAFVAGAGVIAAKIISELLSPELAVQLAEEETKKRKRETASIVSGSSSPGSAARVAAALDDKALLSSDSVRPRKQSALGTQQSSRPMPIGHAESSPVETTLVTRMPLLPKLSKSIPELDGEEGLEILVGAELANEVRTIPIHAIDFSMPYGVNSVDMNNIAQLASLWRSPDSFGDLSFLHQLKHETDQHSRRLAALAAAGSVPGQLGIVPSPDLQANTFTAVKAPQQVALSSLYAQQSHGIQPASRASDRDFPVSKIPSIAPTLGNGPRSCVLGLARAHQTSCISGEFNEGTAVLTPGSTVMGTEATSHGSSVQQLQTDVTPNSARSCGMGLAVTAEYQHGQRKTSRANASPSTLTRSSLPINTRHESAQFHTGQRPQAIDLIVGARNPTNTVAKAIQQMAHKAANTTRSSEGLIPNAAMLPSTYSENVVNAPDELAGRENRSCENCGGYFTAGWRDVPGRVERICVRGLYFSGQDSDIFFVLACVSC